MRRLKQWTSMLLILAMAFALFPPLTANAAGARITITNLYTNTDSATGKPVDDASVPRFTNSPISVIATVENISDTQIQQLYYEITNVSTNTTTVEKANKAKKTGQYQITFENVELTEGLNKITIKLGETSVVSSAPGWAYYTPMVQIQDLRINGAEFVDGRIYPDNPSQSTVLSIEGVAPNATEVQAYLFGDPSPKYAFLSNGEFFFLADDINNTNSTASLRLRPGDNHLTFIAQNSSRSFRAERNLIYDNGQPFAFNATINGQKLITEPTVTSANVNVSALVKVDLDSSGNLEYQYVKVSVGTSVYTVYDLSGMTPDAQWSKSGQYNVYSLNSNFTLPTNDRTQLVKFEFYNMPSDNVPPTEFVFRYENPSDPYIDRVERVIGTSSILLSEGATNEISEQPVTFRIYANENATSVNIYLDDGTLPVSTLSFAHDGNPNTVEYVDYTLSGQPNGIKTLKVVPLAGSTENLSGRKEYTLNISSAPYVLVYNIYNGMIIDSPIANITGRLVNFQNESLLVIVNGARSDDPSSGLGLSINNGIFTLTLPGNILVEGTNTIEFIIELGGVQITQSRYNIFLFSTKAPSFGIIKPIETDADNPKYVPGSNPDTYVTTEKTVALTGTFSDATEIQLTVKTKDKDGNAVSQYERRYSNFTQTDKSDPNVNFFKTVNYNSTTSNGTFETNAINLASSGDTVFEFKITNNTGIVATRVITVTREPQPFTLIYPKFVKNSAGVFEATINSNYVELEIDAESADQVIVNKKEAVLREVNNGIYHYFVEVDNLKPGRNKLNLTVIRGEEELEAELVIQYVDVPVEGAQYKAPMDRRFKVFGGELQLDFPKGTSLMRNDPKAVNQFLTSQRKILFGIANGTDGRVDKYKHPAASDGQQDNPNPPISNNGKQLLTEPTARFRPVSKMFWIDAGTIKKNETNLQEALYGSGRLPYDDDDYVDPFYLRKYEDLVVPTQEGTLTLKYDSNLRGESWRYVTVYYFGIGEDHRGITAPRWWNLGGEVNPKNNTITVPFRGFGYYRVMYMYKSFDDVIAHPWARDSLDTLYSKGIMGNQSSTSFGPNDPITRGEFATLLVKIFDIPLQYDETPTFSDVPRYNMDPYPLYDYRYIESAARAGIIRGTVQGRFMPDSTITRQDAAVMIAQAANLKLNSNTNRTLQSLQKQFTDANLIDIYARAAVDAVVSKKLMSGKENVLLPGQTKATFRFDPRETLTRAEAAAIAIEVLKMTKKIPK